MPIQPCVLCLAQINAPDHILPVHLSCLREMRDLPPKDRMEISIRVYETIQKNHTNNAAKKFVEQLERMVDREEKESGDTLWYWKNGLN